MTNGFRCNDRTDAPRWSRHVFCTIWFVSFTWSCHLVFDVSLPISASLKDQSCRYFRIRFIESRSRRNVLTRFDGHLHLQIQLSSHKSIDHFFDMSLVIVAVVRLLEYSVVIRPNVRKCKCSSWHVISYQVFVLPVLPYPILFLHFPLDDRKSYIESFVYKCSEELGHHYDNISIKFSCLQILSLFGNRFSDFKYKIFEGSKFWDVSWRVWNRWHRSIWTCHSTRYVVRSMSSSTDRHLVSDFIDSLLSCALSRLSWLDTDTSLPYSSSRMNGCLHVKIWYSIWRLLSRHMTNSHSKGRYESIIGRSASKSHEVKYASCHYPLEFLNSKTSSDNLHEILDVPVDDLISMIRFSYMTV